MCSNDNITRDIVLGPAHVSVSSRLGDLSLTPRPRWSLDVDLGLVEPSLDYITDCLMSLICKLPYW